MNNIKTSLLLILLSLCAYSIAQEEYEYYPIDYASWQEEIEQEFQSKNLQKLKHKQAHVYKELQQTFKVIREVLTDIADVALEMRDSSFDLEFLKEEIKEYKNELADYKDIATYEYTYLRKLFQIEEDVVAFEAIDADWLNAIYEHLWRERALNLIVSHHSLESKPRYFSYIIISAPSKE